MKTAKLNSIVIVRIFGLAVAILFGNAEKIDEFVDDGGFDLYLTVKEFVDIDEQHDWSRAVDYCEKKKMKIATVKSEKDKENLLEMLNFEVYRFKSYWLGAHVVNGTYHWFDSQNSDPFTIIDWRSDEPNSRKFNDKSASCMVILPEEQDHKWILDHCFNSHAILCENVTTYNMARVSVKEFIYGQNKVTRTDAERECRYLNGKLAHIRSEIEANQIGWEVYGDERLRTHTYWVDATPTSGKYYRTFAHTIEFSYNNVTKMVDHHFKHLQNYGTNQYYVLCE